MSFTLKKTKTKTKKRKKNNKQKNSSCWSPTSSYYYWFIYSQPFLWCNACDWFKKNPNHVQLAIRLSQLRGSFCFLQSECPQRKQTCLYAGPNFAHLLLISLFYSVAPSLIPQWNKLLKALESVLRFFQVNNWNKYKLVKNSRLS